VLEISRHVSTMVWKLPAGSDSPGVVVARLESLRAQACGNEDGAIPGASEVPAARIVARR